jgi:hypothetical protein
MEIDDRWFPKETVVSVVVNFHKKPGGRKPILQCNIRLCEKMDDKDLNPGFL